MLDLEELERKINNALAKETPESLTKWLMSKRNSGVETYIGEGDYIPCKFLFLQESQHISAEKLAQLEPIIPANAGNTQYAMAA